MLQQAVLAGAARTRIGSTRSAPAARTLVTLLNAMQLRDAKVGITSLCIGGGEAVGMAVELL